MLYVRCQRCGLTSVTAAQWSIIDYCSGCHTELPRVPPAGQWRSPLDVESEVQHCLYGVPGRRAAVDLLGRSGVRRG
jgi:hypothetical protein